VGVLKILGFIGPDGSPTDRYFRFLDQTQSATVLAEGIRDAYRDLFQVNTNAQNMTKPEVMNKMKTLGQGQFRATSQKNSTQSERAHKQSVQP
jgi:uncharacterized protein DUF5343